jgi:hypothetical protein
MLCFRGREKFSMGGLSRTLRSASDEVEIKEVKGNDGVDGERELVTE